MLPILLAALCALVHSSPLPPNGPVNMTMQGPVNMTMGEPWPLDEEGRPLTIDQVIKSAMDSNYAHDLREQDDTVLVELDILYTQEQWDEIQAQRLENESREPSKRKAISYSSSRWTDNTVPYTIDGSYSSSDRQKLQAAMDDYEKWTCISFKERSWESNYISYVNGGGCSSYVGMIGGGQPVTLASWGCRYHATIVHELGHAIGFQHEQCRGDRDDYITIYEQNVNSDMLFNFDKLSQSQANSYGIPYDYTSVMHYGETAFSYNNQAKTIITKDPAYQKVIGNAPTLSFKDLKLANKIYGCASHCGGKTCSGDGYLDKNCECQCEGSPVQSCDGGGGGGGGGGGDCADYDENCPYWGSYCGNNAYVQDNCKLSCGFC